MSNPWRFEEDSGSPHEPRGGPVTYPDGSTRRNIDRPKIQIAFPSLLELLAEDDEMGALEVWRELNHAEQAWVFTGLTTAQRKTIRAASYREEGSENV